MYIDTHTHLYDEKFDQDRNECIQDAIDAGVTKMYMPNCDSSTIAGMLQVENDFPEHCFSMMGLHPCYVKENVDEELKLVREWLERRRFKAVGEIGLDYYWDKTHVEAQKMALHTQTEWALEYGLPIVIHTRESIQDTVDIMKMYEGRGLRGVFHCFSGSYEMARQIIDLGFFLGIGGVLTFKNAGIQEVVQKVGLQHVVLETDAPYLTPAPHRGKRNESAYIPFVATKMAELLGVDTEEVASVTTKNALILFND
ncbi:MAG: TatD family hydrolase [Chitinophagaceae bacterium]|nr:TatD family hydrolase [Chitinophagaceae bacterium]